MRSDVPVGVFLSGGIDSSIVTALMAEIADKPIDTYTVGFERGNWDEREFGRIVAEAFDTTHHEETVSINPRDVLPQIVDHYEMPFGDPSAIPTYYVSQVAAQDRKVVVGGDAGDELFAGYSRYTRDKAVSYVATLPKPVRELLRRGITVLPAQVESPLYYLDRTLEVADGDETERYAPLVCHSGSERLDAVWSGDHYEEEYRYLRDAFERADGPTRMDRVTHVDINTYLPNDILMKVDRATMAHSLEARSPFLDHEFVEFAGTIPAKYKWRRGHKKWILRKAFEDVLPDRIVSREKRGFGAPVGSWIREDLNAFISEKLRRLGERDRFDGQGIIDQLEKHVSGEKDHGLRIWDKLMLELWFERFIDGHRTE